MCDLTEGERAENDAIVASLDTLFWTTADGQEIPLTDLTDSHLNNIISFVQRTISAGYGIASTFRGEQAILSIDSDILQMEGQLEELEIERDRRKPNGPGRRSGLHKGCGGTFEFRLDPDGEAVMYCLKCDGFLGSDSEVDCCHQQEHTYDVRTCCI